MPRKKETIGRRYGIAIAKEYFGRNMRDEALTKSGERAKARLTREVQSDPDALTEEDGAEVSAYTTAIDVYEGIRMAANAYSLQAIANATRAARLLEQLEDAERAHTNMCLRPVLTFKGEDGETPVDAEGRDEQKITLTDLLTVSPEEEPEAFIEDMRNNDLMGRLGLVGKTLLLEKDSEAQRLLLQEGDRGSAEDYARLFELKRATLAQDVMNARRVIESSTRFLDRYTFTAYLLEAFLKIEGVAAFLVPQSALDSARRAGVDLFNSAVEPFTHDFLMRYTIARGNMNMAEAGREYVKHMLYEARELWLYPTEWTDKTEELKKAAKLAAKEMTYADLERIAALETFTNAQMIKRGLA